LGLATAGFGAPVGGEALQGHTAFGLPLPAGSDLYPPAGANPAGLFHLSLPEWARYASLHLGLGPPDYLPPELLAQLHQPWAPDLGASYAPGWHVDAGSWGTELRHNGSDGFWSARFVLIPARGYGILMASNIFSPNAELAAALGAVAPAHQHRGGEELAGISRQPLTNRDPLPCSPAADMVA
jgi:hypothetical protein